MRVISVNVGRLEPTDASRAGVTGHHKRPVASIEVFSPTEARGPSGVRGDELGDAKFHGGTDQAVYAFGREDMDHWESVLGIEIASGEFGENLTTAGIDVNAALIGERWRIGDEVELVVTDPRTPCSTFAGAMQQPRWVKRFTAVGRPGTYLRVAVPGTIRPGDTITVIDRPDHEVTVADVFAAMMVDPAGADDCLRAADGFLSDHVRGILEQRASSVR